MKKLIAALGLLIAVVFAPGTALAHHPEVSGVPTCNDDGSWSVTWTAAPWEPRDATWQVVSPSGYNPAGWQPADLSFTRTATYPSSQSSATETVTTRWSYGARGTRSATVTRPSGCTPSTSTTSTTTTTTSTTTTEPVDTTTTSTTTTTTEPEDTTTTTDDVPPSTDEAPPVTDDVPPSTDEAPPVTDDVPPSTDEAPPVTDDVPPSTDEAPPVTDGTPGTDNAPPPTDVSGEGPPDTSGGTTGGETPTLPATGNNGLNNMLTAALVLFGFGALTVSAARGQRSELVDS